MYLSLINPAIHTWEAQCVGEPGKTVLTRRVLSTMFSRQTKDKDRATGTRHFAGW